MGALLPDIISNGFTIGGLAAAVWYLDRRLIRIEAVIGLKNTKDKE